MSDDHHPSGISGKLKQLEELKLKFGEVNLHMWELKEKLEEEKEKTAALLRNILPERVIRDLQEKGSSSPEAFENVTVFFSDIAGFTEAAADMEPVELIGELSDIFGNFDRIFAKNHCLRIKTAGDAYLGVSGLPEEDSRHCLNILDAASEAMEYLRRRNEAAKISGGRCWQMRVGIHTGRVVAGIVGHDRFIYDVFGDTVNTASRLETNAEAMTINVSEKVKLMAEKDPAYTFLPRRPKTVKGKGIMKMYFLKWQQEG